MATILHRHEPHHGKHPASELRSILVKRPDFLLQQAANGANVATFVVGNASSTPAVGGATPREKKHVRLFGVLTVKRDSRGRLVETVYPTHTVLYDEYPIDRWPKVKNGDNDMKYDRERGDDEGPEECSGSWESCWRWPNAQRTAEQAT